MAVSRRKTQATRMAGPIELATEALDGTDMANIYKGPADAGKYLITKSLSSSSPSDSVGDDASESDSASSGSIEGRGKSNDRQLHNPAGPNHPSLRGRRQAHIVSEQKRRQNINDGFNELRRSIPSCQNSHDSKAVILRKAVLHIRNLQDELAQLQRSIGVSGGASTAEYAARSRNGRETDFSSDMYRPPASQAVGNAYRQGPSSATAVSRMMPVSSSAAHHQSLLLHPALPTQHQLASAPIVSGAPQQPHLAHSYPNGGPTAATPLLPHPASQGYPPASLSPQLPYARAHFDYEMAMAPPSSRHSLGNARLPPSGIPSIRSCAPAIHPSLSTMSTALSGSPISHNPPVQTHLQQASFANPTKPSISISSLINGGDLFPVKGGDSGAATRCYSSKYLEDEIAVATTLSNAGSAAERIAAEP